MPAVINNRRFVSSKIKTESAIKCKKCIKVFLRIPDRYYRLDSVPILPISGRGLQSKTPSEAGKHMIVP